MSLTGKVAIVTGSGRGLGLAYAAVSIAAGFALVALASGMVRRARLA